MPDNMQIQDGVLISFREKEKMIVDIPEGVEVIGERAFEGNYHVIEVRLPSTLREIRRNAFDGCFMLRKIQLPDTLRLLGEEVFRNCGSLRSIRIPAGVTEIPAGAFLDCEVLEEAVLSEGVKHIRAHAFEGCRNLTELSLPQTLETIGEKALSGTPAPERLVLPESVTTLGSRFLSGKGLQELQAPGVTDLQDGALSDLKGLQRLLLPHLPLPRIPASRRNAAIPCFIEWYMQGGQPEEEVLHSYTNNLRRRRESFYPQALTSPSLMNFLTAQRIIPEEDMHRLLEQAARNGNPEISALLLRYKTECFGEPNPEKESASLLRQLDTGALTIQEFRRFWRSSNLPDGTLMIRKYLGCAEHVVVPAKVGKRAVTAIGEGAFADNGSIASVILPDSILEIRRQAFRKCTALRDVLLPEGLQTIGESAFSGCAALEEIRFPETLTSIGDNAFEESGLQTLTVPDSVRTVGRYAFHACPNLVSASLPAGLKELPEGLFQNCRNLARVEVASEDPAGRSEPQEWVDTAFKDCASLTELSIPAQARFAEKSYPGSMIISEWKVHPDNPFLRVEKRLLLSRDRTILYAWSPGPRYPKHVVIPEGVVEIRPLAFVATGVESVSFPSSLKRIGFYAFCHCGLLEKIRFAAGPQVISIRAFMKCTGLRAVTIPDGLQRLGEKAFSGCTSLTQLYLPEKMEAIGENCFENCTSLRRTRLPDFCPSIGSSTFAGCSSLTTITFPAGEKSLKEYMFRGCKNLRNIDFPNCPLIIEDANAFLDCNSLEKVCLPGDLGKTHLRVRVFLLDNGQFDCYTYKGSPADAEMAELYQRSQDWFFYDELERYYENEFFVEDFSDWFI